MSILFFILSILAYIFGFMIFATAKSAIHEGVAFIVILNGTVFFVGAAIIDTIKNKVSLEQNGSESASEKKIEPTVKSALDDNQQSDSLAEGQTSETPTVRPLESQINSELVDSLKVVNFKVGFNSTFNPCEICNQSNTGQTINGHYVCNACKDKYL
ncbi:hypothetical protein [Vibrio vulnificus]|uniref:hypothetical protein n=1 Tax=Vibrio vulnificus TaxID=672 RepID=UPI00102B434A|nr:hypothetical protein [Vibrio vulnificus]MCA3991400.1 hypothetical protein [Vibrio vulnificus]RZQ90297.1 hypothetical protein D8T27_04395 [Vibrio vulnificus]